MGLLSGTAGVTRFAVTARPEEPDFEEFAFREIPPESEIRERVGFVPFEPGAPYRVGQLRFAFRLRIDTRKADPTAVRERVKELVKADLDSGTVVGPRRRKAHREQAEEELLLRATPRTRVIECCLDNDMLWVGTTANAHLGTVLALAAAAGITAEYRTPWIDRHEEELMSDIVAFEGGVLSVLGCRFLKVLARGDEEVMVEPEAGAASIAVPDGRVTLQGAITEDLHRYVQRDCELLSLRLLWESAAFRLDGPSWRVSGLRIETERYDNWIELLDARLEKIAAVYDTLDSRYAAVSSRLRG